MVTSRCETEWHAMVTGYQDLDRSGLVGDCSQEMTVESVGGHRSGQGTSSSSIILASAPSQ